jgi:hypothetical protein
MVFAMANGRFVLKTIVPFSLSARILALWTRLRGVWLCKVGGSEVTREEDVVATLAGLNSQGKTECLLTFLHPEVSNGLNNEGIPQVNLDQMNLGCMANPSLCAATMGHDRNERACMPDFSNNGLLATIDNEGMLTYVSSVMKLSAGSC